MPTDLTVQRALASALEYLDRALCIDPIKQRLAARLTTRLFDIERSTRSLEAALTEAYERHRRGSPPADIVCEDPA
jgi:hypothetical protein